MKEGSIHLIWPQGKRSSIFDVQLVVYKVLANFENQCVETTISQRKLVHTRGGQFLMHYFEAIMLVNCAHRVRIAKMYLKDSFVG